VQTTPGQHQKKLAAHAPASHQIGSRVANQIGPAQIYAHLLGYLQQHTWLRLAATTAIFWAMWAVDHPINATAVGLHISYHTSMNIVHHLGRHHSPAHDGLVGDYDDG
jgi:hypothetical protein